MIIAAAKKRVMWLPAKISARQDFLIVDSGGPTIMQTCFRADQVWMSADDCNILTWADWVMSADEQWKYGRFAVQAGCPTGFTSTTID